MDRTRVLIIANPAAVAVTPALVWELVRVCRRQARDVSVRWTTSPGEATRIARKLAESVAVPLSLSERAFAFPSLGASPAVTRTVVVAVGGDGTVREVAAGLASAWRGVAPTPLLIVPAGGTNACYHSLYGTSPWQSTVESALRASDVRRLDLARVAGRLVFIGRSQLEHDDETPPPCPPEYTVDVTLSAVPVLVPPSLRRRSRPFAIPARARRRTCAGSPSARRRRSC